MFSKIINEHIAREEYLKLDVIAILQIASRYNLTIQNTNIKPKDT